MKIGFLVTPKDHKNSKYGCSDCALIGSAENNRSKKEDREKKITDAHGDRYQYFDIGKGNVSDKFKILCYLHGYFYQTLKDHYKKGGKASGCPECGKNEHNIVHSFLLDKFEVVTCGAVFDWCANNIGSKIPYSIALPSERIVIELRREMDFNLNMYPERKEIIEEKMLKIEIKTNSARSNGFSIIIITMDSIYNIDWNWSNDLMFAISKIRADRFPQCVEL